MLESFSTTQQNPLIVGAVEYFGEKNLQLRNAAGVLMPWDLTGGSASTTLSSPSGATTVLAGTISTVNVTFAPWTVNTPGLWRRTSIYIDATGFTQLSKPFLFHVEHA